MARLPATRNVNVTVTRNDNFVARDGFGTPILLTTQEIAGVLDSDVRTKAYGSIDEVAADFNGTDAFYKAAEAAFSQEQRPLLIKAGYVDGTAATDAASLKDELDAISDFDDGWYWMDVEAGLRDDAMLDGLVEWAEARDVIAVVTSNDENIESLADTTNIAARHKGTVENTAVFYSKDADEYPGFAMGAYLGGFNFDDARSAYTAKYKKLRGMQPLNVRSSVANIVQGWIPGIGQDTAAGHLANCIIDQGGQFFVEQGSVLSPNVFIDEVHMTHWLTARTQEEIMNLKLNTRRIPYTDNGLEQIANVVRAQLQRAFNAGLVADDNRDAAGNFLPNYEVIVPSVFDVAESQRKSRIAPAIEARFRYAGAVHFTNIKYTVSF